MDDQLKRRETLEVYSNIVNVEVRSLVQRISELSSVVSSFSGDFGTVLLQVEDLSNKIESIQSSVEFLRTELAALRKVVAEHSVALGTDVKDGDKENL